VVDLRRGRGSFEFLGCTLRKKRSILRTRAGRFYSAGHPPKAMKRVRGRIHELTDRRRAGAKLRDIIGQLNPVLRGWGNYFRSGNADDKFNQVDHYVPPSPVQLALAEADSARASVSRNGPSSVSSAWACII